MNKYPTFEACCEAKGYDPATVLPDVSMFPEQHREALLANAKLIIVAEAHNGDWKPNWDDDDEEKWYPWFDLEVDDRNPSGFRFNASTYDYSRSYVGSRLCFASSEISHYVGKHFEDLYRAMMVLQK